MPAAEPTWDPARYLTYADERSRPFGELLARVPADADRVRTVVDLGCGPGHLTPLLTSRWHGATVHGLDSSPEMVAAARDRADGATYDVADLRDWLADDERADVLVTNATLQWVPDHLALLPRLVAQVAPGGWLAFQVPANATAPIGSSAEELRTEAPYSPHADDAPTVRAHEPVDYLVALAALGAEVDAWATTYEHVLPVTADDPDPVLTWVTATGARPTLDALPADLRPRFREELGRRLRAAYPHRDVGGRPAAVLPFRRVFVVAHVA